LSSRCHRRRQREKRPKSSERPLQAVFAASEFAVSAVVGAAFQGSGSFDFWEASIGCLYIYRPTVVKINSCSPHLHALTTGEQVRTPYVSSASKYCLRTLTWQLHGDFTLQLTTYAMYDAFNRLLQDVACGPHTSCATMSMTCFLSALAMSYPKTPRT
jgi:hypothetical protein